MFKKIQIVGNLGKDPEIRHLQNGGLAGNFSVAVNESWTNREGTKEQRTTWFNVVAYQQGDSGLVSALIKPYLRKGQLVFIDADPTIRKWVDQAGNDRYSFEIKLGPQSTIKMLGGRPNGERRSADDGDDGGFDGRHREPRGDGADEHEPGRPAARRTPAEQLDDDIPF
jgi:single-strand DNA-binding protein